MPDGDRAIRARAFWSGTISFGLVSIPVNLFPANRPNRVSLRMLDADGTPLARRYYDPETDRPVPNDALVRGYEIRDGEFVLVTDRELEAIEPQKTRDIDLRRFVDRDDIDPIYFERAYFLTPAGNSPKAYQLLAATMERTNRAGIATFVMRTKEYLVAILAENGILRAETLRFHDEIRSVDGIDLPERPKLKREQVRAVEEAIEAISADSLEEDELEDDYADRLLALVEAKRKQGGDVVRAPASVVDEEATGTEVIDLMEVLKRSLGAGAGERRPPRRAGGGAGDEDLEGLTKAELYERAREREVPGRSSMTKDQLIRALRRSA